MGNLVFGMDIGGSGIKGAPVDTDAGALAAERVRIPTPDPATPDAVAATAAELVKGFGWKGPLGCGFPAVIRGGVALTAANIDKSWIGCDAARLLGRATGCRAVVLNDADAAGTAMLRFEPGLAARGVVLVVTVGTGLGTALFVDGILVPNLELGHIEFRGREAEQYCSDAVRKEADMPWEKYGRRLSRWLAYMEGLFWPDRILVGGGIAKKWDLVAPFIETRTPVNPASLQNEAGIIGAACAAKAAP